jgi:5-methylthioribose kinase
MDLGFFLSHLILKACRLARRRREYFELTREFWRSYGAVVSFQPIRTLESRAIEHFAVCALARIDGTSPVDYLPEEPRRESVRNLARRALAENVKRWEHVLGIAEELFARLP